MAVSEVMLALRRALSFPNDLLFYLTRDGDWKLRYPTDVVIEHFLTKIDASNRAKIVAQLKQPLVQRWWHKGRINPIFHYVLDPETQLEDAAYKDDLYRIEMFVEGKKQWANITFVDGKLFCVELAKPFKFYESKSIIFGDVKRGKTSQSITRAIDRLEHGRDNDV